MPGSHASSYSLKESSSQTICTEGGGGGTSQKIFLLMPKDKKIDTGQARATNIDYRNVLLSTLMGFPDSSVGKESACNAGDPGLTPGSGRSSGEGISYPLQYSWASLLGQLVKNPPAKKKKEKKNPPAMWETWVQSLCWEDPLEKEKSTHSSILAWRILWII